MLLRLLRTFLGSYRRDMAIIVGLQALQTFATLFLPSLNADVIDKGIIPGDTGYIWRTGVVMLGVTLFQVVCATGAVYFGSRTAMAFGRDVRDGLFHQVTAYSAREVGELGAPSLITRVTNDVQQVQMFLLMTFTLLIAAPITCVGGIVMALREDVGLSWILTVSIPLLVGGVGLVVSRMVPYFRLMQDRIDGVNRVLREQIIGIRVVRAFVREPAERRRFAVVNEELTDTALSAGHLQAFMFPIVLLVLNGSSVAVLWFGAGRIDRGAMQIGALIAFLSYLVQILLAVMMATFMAVLAPRAAVCAERIIEVLDTPSSVVSPTRPSTEVAAVASLVLRGVGFHYPGAEEPVLTGIDLTVSAGQTTAVNRQHRGGKDHPAVAGAPPLRRHRGPGAGRRGRRARPGTRSPVASHRAGAPEALPVQRHRRIQPPLRRSRGQRSGALGGAGDRPGGRLRAGHARRAGRADLPGRLERVRRPTPAPGHRPGPGPPDPRSTCSTTPSPPSTWPPMPACAPPWLRRPPRPPWWWSPQRVASIIDADQILVLEDGHMVGLGTHGDLPRGPAPPTRRSWSRSCGPRPAA